MDSVYDDVSRSCGNDVCLQSQIEALFWYQREPWTHLKDLLANKAPPFNALFLEKFDPKILSDNGNTALFTGGFVMRTAPPLP